MRFIETDLKDARLVELEMRGDERGWFARGWCQNELAGAGLTAQVAQANISFSKDRGTLRGMHFQRAPFAEAKLIRCTRGAIWDAIIDVRPASPTYRRWLGAELTAENHRMLYVPEGFAHGFLTLTDDVEVMYLVSEFYTPAAEGGVRWNDPAFGIAWPFSPTVISAKDQAWPDFAGPTA